MELYNGLCVLVRLEQAGMAEETVEGKEGIENIHIPKNGGKNGKPFWVVACVVIVELASGSES